MIKVFKLIFATGAFLFVSALAKADIHGIYTYPGGRDGDIQFNQKGTFSGSNGDLSYSSGTKTLSVSTAAVTTLKFNDGTSMNTAVPAICPNITPPAGYTGFICNGMTLCLYVNGSQQECWPPIVVVNKAEFENGQKALFEDLSFALFEH